jgi:hypothetical protein
VRINLLFDPNRRAVITPGGRYRYQLCPDEDDEEDLFMFTVWRRDKDDSWLVELKIEVDDNMEPQTVFFPERRPKQTPADVTRTSCGRRATSGSPIEKLYGRPRATGRIDEGG